VEFKNVSHLPRNDVDACRRFYAERGSITGQELRTMLHLQDDHAHLSRVFADEGWRVSGGS
jgi:hypothetical protein